MEDNRIGLQEKMFSLIEQWEQSDLSKKVFCIQHQIANATFHYWYKKYKNKDANSLKSFIPIRVKGTPSAADQPFVDLTFPDGKKLTFYSSVEASLLKSLLS